MPPKDLAGEDFAALGTPLDGVDTDRGSLLEGNFRTELDTSGVFLLTLFATALVATVGTRITSALRGAGADRDKRPFEVCRRRAAADCAPGCRSCCFSGVAPEEPPSLMAADRKAFSALMLSLVTEDMSGVSSPSNDARKFRILLVAKIAMRREGKKEVKSHFAM